MENSLHKFTYLVIRLLAVCLVLNAHCSLFTAAAVEFVKFVVVIIYIYLKKKKNDFKNNWSCQFKCERGGALHKLIFSNSNNIKKKPKNMRLYI